MKTNNLFKISLHIFKKTITSLLIAAYGSSAVAGSPIQFEISPALSNYRVEPLGSKYNYNILNAKGIVVKECVVVPYDAFVSGQKQTEETHACSSLLAELSLNNHQQNASPAAFQPVNAASIVGAGLIGAIVGISAGLIQNSLDFEVLLPL